jgi:hypothetical protein
VRSPLIGVDLCFRLDLTLVTEEAYDTETAAAGYPVNHMRNAALLIAATEVPACAQ